MTNSVSQLLTILQRVSQAGIRLTCVQLSTSLLEEHWSLERRLQEELVSLEQRATRLLATMSPDERSEVKLGRALFLQMLVESAPRRLRGWSDQDRLDQMPPSRLFEWIAHDHEQLELAQVEAQMTPEEAARYVSASSPLQG
ncbi:hypothetical protein QTH87_12690 [Variovorax sp. J22P168]|uniref:hypothetical protein n=1 Tax=Variovorax jilinensis TaxID=3053513 RepID=UPI0025767400|nr:hypothetical protein [Variovorax sp. J22P168]MDM0013293.1 hypothetical protein [Variovorax sp. J22P168]